MSYLGNMARNVWWVGGDHYNVWNLMLSIFRFANIHNASGRTREKPTRNHKCVFYFRLFEAYCRNSHLFDYECKHGCVCLYIDMRYVCLLTQSVLPRRAWWGWCPSCWERQKPCPPRRVPPPSSADHRTCSSLCSDEDDRKTSDIQHVWMPQTKQLNANFVLQ